MCDNCLNREELVKTDVTQYLNDLIAILNNASNLSERMTALKLMDSWFGKGNKKLRLDSIRVPNISRDICEQIVGLLLIDGYLKEDFHFTPYSTISYLIVGSRSHIRSKDLKIYYYLNLATNNSNNSNKKNKLNKESKEISAKKQKVNNKTSNDVICID
jgi:ATP-dependent DNA helicase Q1